MPRRNRALSIFIMPIGIFLWIIGWSLYWIGQTKQTSQNKPKPSDQTWLTFIETTQELAQAKPR